MIEVSFAAQDEVPEALRENAEEREGRWVVKIESGEGVGVVPTDKLAEANAKLTKLDEFRENNRKMHKQLEEMKTQLGSYEGIDPAAHKAALEKLAELESKAKKTPDDITNKILAAQKPLQDRIDELMKAQEKIEAEKLEAMRQAAQSRLEGQLRDAGNTVGVAEGAMMDFLSRGTRVWQMVDGKPMAMDGDEPVMSRKTGQPIDLTEWAEDLRQEAGHLFAKSGGGAAAGSKGTKTSTTVIDANDPLAVGKAAEKIAKGEAVVVSQS